jgi:uncharacterized membrane protein
MHWQDWALACASFVFIIALVPTVLSADRKPAISTSVLNAAVSASVALVYLTLSLWFAAITTAANAVLWVTIALQTYALHTRYFKPEPERESRTDVGR